MTDRWEWLFRNEPIALVQDLFGHGRPLPFQILSLLGDTWGIIFVTGLALWLFGRRAMYSLIGIVIVGAAMKLVLSGIFDVPRPSGPGIQVYERLEIGAFPSGHVFQAIGPWGQLHALGRVPLWLPALVAVLVGLGRLYLGAHYLTDVLAGIALGALVVWGYTRVWPGILGSLEKRRPGFFLGTAAVAAGGTLLLMITSGGDLRRFEIYGMVLAAVPALLFGRRLAPLTPAAGTARPRIGRVSIGALGIIVLLLWNRSQGEQALLLGTLTAGIATLWALVGAPALFRALGLDDENDPGDRMEGAGTTRLSEGRPGRGSQRRGT